MSAWKFIKSGHENTREVLEFKFEILLDILKGEPFLVSFDRLNFLKDFEGEDRELDLTGPRSRDSTRNKQEAR